MYYYVIRVLLHGNIEGFSPKKEKIMAKKNAKTETPKTENTNTENTNPEEVKTEDKPKRVPAVKTITIEKKVKIPGVGDVVAKIKVYQTRDGAQFSEKADAKTHAREISPIRPAGARKKQIALKRLDNCRETLNRVCAAFEDNGEILDLLNTAGAQIANAWLKISKED